MPETTTRRERKYSGRKAAMHKFCQRQTKREIRRGKRPLNFAPFGNSHQSVSNKIVLSWRVVNRKTHREVVVVAPSAVDAVILAMSGHRLARNVENLTVEKVN